MTRPTHCTIHGIELTWRVIGTLPTDSGSATEIGIWSLADPDAMLDQLTQEEFDATDERMPYFGLIWPSAEALVPWLLQGPSLEGLRVLDLGCGLGPCGFASAHRGAHVTFFDWEPRALEIIAASAREQSFPASRIELSVGDWRTPPDFGAFDRIIGADVLYEARNAEPVASFLSQHLRPRGEAWIADPGHLHAQAFPEVALQHGLQMVERLTLSTTPQGGKIDLLRFVLAK
jgi:2-polyprenyl-3-methyl-5-hydroxy-6-metoxy-1,4-benzoquinol methylase